MSSLRVRQMQNRIRSLFESDLDLHGIGATDPERDLKILTRCLAAFAIYSATGCSEAEASSAVWDGGDDNCVDGAFYDPSEKQVVIVQSKWIQSGTGEPSATDISSFAGGIKDLIEGDLDAFGDRLKPRVETISNALMQPGTTIRIILASTGASVIAPHGTRNITRLLNELNEGEDDGIATFEVIGMNEVFAGLSSEGTVGKINLSATLLDWSRVNHPHSAYFGIIDGAQLKAWWGAHGKRLVAKNIRHALGDTDVNLQIRATATSEPEHFWYFNNGITLIAEDATRAPAAAASHLSGNFELKGASIVNGAQTVSTLARVDDEALGKVKVSIRIVILKDAPEKFGADVTRTNNLQNRVEGRDFVSDDPVQAKIKSEMAMEGVDYQFHRSGDFISSPTSCDLIEVTTALACASSDTSLSVAAKTGIGRFFNDLAKAPYKSVFNPNTTGARAFNAIRVMRAIDEWIADTKGNTIKKSGYSWGVLIHGNRAIAASVFKKLGNGMIDRSINDFDHLYKDKVIAACNEVYPKIVHVLEEKFPSKALAVLFKGPNNCKIIYDDVSST
ncbi:MAG: AIPR family protein [Asticcacaulis sp.]|uniref:AIPR family protein n=1 Tax=Asticcacaulis sp. TaxID=1872648 RepID=UPI0039E22840